jgi:acyl-coenzyme A synthetase/AMP-(fatty) acid ligase
VWIAAHSFSFDFSVWETFGALLTGARLVIAQNEDVRDIGLFTQLVANEGVSVLNQTPAAFYTFSDVSVQRQLEFPALRYVIFGGDKLQPLRLTNWVARFPLTAVKLINMYGITETTVHVSYYALEQSDSDGTHHGSVIGRPLPETTMWVVDRFDNLQPPNIPGEILVGGSGVSLGYINRPELNAQRFFEFSPSDSVPAERVYRSGDRGCLRENRGIEYLGREDDQVQVRGYRIELAEIERCFLSHQSVQGVAIITIENDETVELSAYLVGDKSGAPSQWHDYFDKRLPSYMLPARVSWLDAIPLTPNGKVDVKRLAAMDSIASSPAGSAESESIAMPDEVDTEVSLCWREVIGVSGINTTDNFFSIGGHSLKAVTLAELIQRRLGVDFSISEVFEVPIFSEMVARLRPRVEQNLEIEQKGVASQQPDSSALDALVDAVDLDALENLLNQIENGQ